MDSDVLHAADRPWPEPLGYGEARCDEVSMIRSSEKGASFLNVIKKDLENDYGQERTNLWYRIRNGADDPPRDGRSELARKHTDRCFLDRPGKTDGARRDTPAAGSETRAPLDSRCISTKRSADLRVRSGSVADKRVGLFERAWEAFWSDGAGLLRSSVRTWCFTPAAGSETRAPFSGMQSMTVHLLQNAGAFLGRNIGR